MAAKGSFFYSSPILSPRPAEYSYPCCGALKDGYQFNMRPALGEMYSEADVFWGAVLNATTQDGFVLTFGQPDSVADTAYLYLEAEARRLECSWGYAVFALINNKWQPLSRGKGMLAISCIRV